MYNFKRIAALGLAMTMALGSSLTAFAAEATTEDATKAIETAKEYSGVGSEEYLDKNVMKVTMPTDAAVTKAFSYKLDPQGIIAEAKSYAGTAITGTATGIVFLNSAGGKSVISNTSDPFTITNKSSIPVDLGVEAKLEAADTTPMDITLASTTSDFSTTADASKAFYLGLKATNDIERALSGTAITPNVVLLSGASQYETKWDTTANSGAGAYVFAEKSNAKFSDFTFNITGAINKSLGASTWATITGDVGADDRDMELKNPPKVSLKVTLTPVENPLPLTLKWTSVTDGGVKVDVLQVTKKDGGKFVAADVANVYVNGKPITSGNYTIGPEDGILTIKLEKIYANYYSDWSDAAAAKKTSVKSLIKNVKTTATSKPTFYGEL